MCHSARGLAMCHSALDAESITIKLDPAPGCEMTINPQSTV
jgi:hypothetical protein